MIDQWNEIADETINRFGKAWTDKFTARPRFRKAIADALRSAADKARLSAMDEARAYDVAMRFMDDNGIPRTDPGGAVLSLNGRILTSQRMASDEARREDAEIAKMCNQNEPGDYGNGVKDASAWIESEIRARLSAPAPDATQAEAGQADEIVNLIPESVALKRESTELRKRLAAMTKDRDSWKVEWEMCVNAWTREVDYLMEKTHTIDALVLATRVLRERAEKAEADAAAMRSGLAVWLRAADEHYLVCQIRGDLFDGLWRLANKGKSSS
jgi:hypothetical protein